MCLTIFCGSIKRFAFNFLIGKNILIWSNPIPGLIYIYKIGLDLICSITTIHGLDMPNANLPNFQKILTELVLYFPYYISIHTDKTSIACCYYVNI